MSRVKNALRTAYHKNVGEKFWGVGEMCEWVGEKCENAEENKGNHVVNGAISSYKSLFTHEMYNSDPSCTDEPNSAAQGNQDLYCTSAALGPIVIPLLASRAFT